MMPYLMWGYYFSIRLNALSNVTNLQSG